MEILTALQESPMGPAKLGLVCNVPYERVSVYVRPLEAKGLLRSETKGAREVLHITPDGSALLLEWTSLKEKIPL